MEKGSVTITPFDWKAGWPALWELRRHQLAGEGIIIEPVKVGPPDLDSPYERDYHRIDQVYMTGAGGFWIAWWGDRPAGHVGVQDVGGSVELRRMYVRAGYRRRGIGTQLVHTLIAHCEAQNVAFIELWTASDGPGRRLYEKVGFRVIDEPPNEVRKTLVVCPYVPSDDEIRMRFTTQTFPGTSSTKAIPAK